MRYLALATDYDGTLASEGRMHGEVTEALKRLRVSGRRIILATGRRLSDLRGVLPQMELFDCIVAENGAVLYVPQMKEELILSEPLPASFVDRLRALGVPHIEVGQAIVATTVPAEGCRERSVRGGTGSPNRAPVPRRRERVAGVDSISD